MDRTGLLQNTGKTLVIQDQSREQVLQPYTKKKTQYWLSMSNDQFLFIYFLTIATSWVQQIGCNLTAKPWSCLGCWEIIYAVIIEQKSSPHALPLGNLGFPIRNVELPHISMGTLLVKWHMLWRDHSTWPVIFLSEKIRLKLESTLSSFHLWWNYFHCIRFTCSMICRSLMLGALVSVFIW